jgi:nucleoside 2-deoxyribosyltransferase
MNTIMEGRPPACIYISCEAKYRSQLQDMVTNGQLFGPSQLSDPKQWVWLVFSDHSWDIETMLKMINKSDCVIVYFQPSDDIGHSLIEIGAFLALRKEVIISGAGTNLVLEKILQSSKCIARENFTDAINYSRSLYYQ